MMKMPILIISLALLGAVLLGGCGGGGGGAVSQEPVILAPVITSPDIAYDAVGTPFTYQITATNAPLAFSAKGLPAGLTLSATGGTITGTPTDTADATVAITAANADGIGTAILTLTTAPVTPVINSPTTATVLVGGAFSYQITATNDPTSFAAAPLPPGLTFADTGSIVGTPTAVGTSVVTLTATNDLGTGTAPLTINVIPAAPVITSATAITAAYGTYITYQITASGAPTSFNVSGLPNDLGCNVTSGLIAGVLQTAGTTVITVTATNDSGTGSATVAVTAIGTAAPGAGAVVAGSGGGDSKKKLCGLGGAFAVMIGLMAMGLLRKRSRMA
jgi:hypothetical protein